ncbi:MAG: long-chain fatty acid--CoA ligase [Bdellovibrionales bacterium]|nr:long-chain fatty acid--CoA ligase [Bdellovibrionales bacterium]
MTSEASRVKPGPTVLHRLRDWAKAHPNSPGQGYKKGDQWRVLTAREYCDRVYHLALFLESKGFGKNDVGTIFGYNSPEWVHADLAMLLLGGKSAGIYPNSAPKDILYILNHTESRILSVQNAEYFKKFAEGDSASSLPERIEMIIVFDGDCSISPKAVAYETAIAEGRRIAESGNARTLDELLSAIDPMAGAFMIYTSGTTGYPKGALLSHDNMVYTSDRVRDYWRLPDGGRLFSFLPLCHIAEKLQNIGVGITMQYQVSFATKFEKVAAEIPEVEPTLLLSVPRLWEKMVEGVLGKLEKAPAARQKLASWALATGARCAEIQLSQKPLPFLDLLQLQVADKLVLSKIRKALGLGQALTLASGAAALPAHVSRWFRSIGLEILEDYGQTETTGVVCMTEPGVDSAGTVGKPVPGMEFMIAPDGEMLTRGRHVFVGYYKDAENTKATFDSEGWLHTGDLAELTPRGLVKIRGRKKEIMKTSGGKMIAPLPIEEKIKVHPMVSQVCLVGDNRKFISALITLGETTLGQLKTKQGSNDGRVVSDSDVIKAVRSHVDGVNAELANFEQVKKVTLLAQEFSIEAGEMTPTLKMKRNVIESRYKDLIDQMYSE